MKLDKSDYYPYTPGTGFLEEENNREEAESLVENPQTNTGNDSNPGDEKEKDADIAGMVITRMSNILSWVMVPMLVSVWATIMMFNLSSLSLVNYGTKVVFTLIVLGLNAVIPMVFVFILKSMGIVKDLGLNGRKERLLPYIIMILSYVGTAVFFLYKGAPLWTGLFFFGAATAALINTLINFRWKISAHAAGAAGVVGMLLIIQRVGMPMVDLGWWTAGTILLTGLLGSARVWLGRHTVMQVLAGYAVGFLSVYLISLIN